MPITEKSSAGLAGPVRSAGRFAPGVPVIDPVKMLRIHGYRDLEKVRPVIRKAADDIAVRAAGVMSPVIHFKRVGVAACTKTHLHLDNGLTFSNQAFARYLSEAAEVIAVVITVGKGLDDEVIGCMDRFEPLEALFLETAGWLGIEWTTKKFVEYMAAEIADEDLRVTRRMGPGYSYKIDGDEAMWSLEEQRQLFEIFEGVDLPVRLLESCAMMPKMSRSGLYGLVSGKFVEHGGPRQGSSSKG